MTRILWALDYGPFRHDPEHNPMRHDLGKPRYLSCSCGAVVVNLHLPCGRPFSTRIGRFAGRALPRTP